MIGSELFSSKPSVHFALEDDLINHDDGDSDTNTSIGTPQQLETARSSPMPTTPSSSTSNITPFASTSTSTFNPDSQSTPSASSSIPIFEFEEPATPSIPNHNNQNKRRESSEFYPPKPLKSSLKSREVEFDQNDNDDEYLSDQDDAPLMMQGLLQQNQSRISMDNHLSLGNGSGSGSGSSKKNGKRPQGYRDDNGEDEEEEEEDDGNDQEGLIQNEAAPRILRQLEQNPDVPEWVSTGAGLAANSEFLGRETAISKIAIAISDPSLESLLHYLVANMSNSILGAGIIGLPYALREAGFVMGIVLLVVLGAVTDWTIRLVVLDAKMSGRRTYIDIMDTCFGPYGRAAVSFFQFAFAFGGMCAFCVILGDTIPRVLNSIIPGEHGAFVQFLISRQFVITILTVGISYPLSLYRDIAKLSGASTLALISMVVIVVSVAIRGPSVADDLKGDASARWTFINSGFFEAIGVISFAFVCHHNSLLIYGSLKTPTLDRFAKVTHVSTSLSVVACLTMSISGFLVFTDRTAGNILNNFSSDDTLINIARACLGANMFSTLPLEAFVCREVLENYFWPEQPYNAKRHIIITSGLVFSAMLVSLITCDLGLVLELAGGFSATALAYLFPAACYLKLSSSSSKSSKNAITRLAAWTCAAFGVLVMILSTFLSITKALAGTSHKVC